MNNNQYISALKKALNGMDRNSRSDILQEIESHAAESGTPLIERFGSPEELAKQYLDGEIIAKPMGTRVLGVGKKLLMWVGIIIALLLAAIVGFIWYMSGDEYNYADEKLALEKSQGAEWVSKDWNQPLSFNITQTSAVFYWNDENTLRWNCLSSKQPQLEGNGQMDVRQAKCVFYLPNVETSIRADQAQLVLVRPQVSLDLNIEQTRLRIAENGTQYRYETDAKRARVDGLKSYEDAELSIRIEANESMIGAYSEE